MKKEKTTETSFFLFSFFERTLEENRYTESDASSLGASVITFPSREKTALCPTQDAKVTTGVRGGRVVTADCHRLVRDREELQIRT